MNVKINSKGVELNAEQRDYFAKKMEKLDKYQVTFHSQDVFFKMEPAKQYHAEISVKSSVGSLEASADNANIGEAFNEAYDRLERQLLKKKEKPLAHRSDNRELEHELLNREEEAQATDEAIEEVKQTL
ncbi:ribosome hibernation-promoting factor, HPF/YfiA family [Shewanella marina]|uniref:ribosome hibernation-promoting factor, HPF/YfiA family n=1 Tax=Shewanella marina TaxID=487319 RepID=UPI000472DF45|nr:ribosome-associated translation inhibitor RaiA [Shewanella marina]